MSSTQKKNSPLAIVAMVGLFLAAGVIFYLYSWQGTKAGREGAYYLDLNTGKVFIAAASAFPPIETASGPFEGRGAGVRIHIYSCKSLGSLAGMTLEQIKAKGAFPVWLEQFTPEAKSGLEAGEKNPELLMSGLLNRAIDGGKWIDATSKPAIATRESIKGLCPGGTAVACEP